MSNIRIAIDGPAGAGKGTIAKNVAKKLNILHLDTGAMYRAVGLNALNNGIDPQNEKEVMHMLKNIEIGIEYENGAQKTLLNGEDVSNLIRTKDVSNAASAVSKWSSVRKKLVAIQQDISKRKSIVMDGRDIGTYVMPGAEHKFFLTASVNQRAKRRFDELSQKGFELDLEEIEKDIAKRDYQDSNREHSPLFKADDAYEIDTTHLGINEVLDVVYKKLGI
jgi:cytidylate kinase